MLQVACILLHYRRQLPADPLVAFAFYSDMVPISTELVENISRFYRRLLCLKTMKCLGLLEKGADVNTFGGYCHSALHAAVLYSRAISCELLVKNGAHWSLVDRKPSHLAEWRLYNACEVLQNCRERQERGWPKEDSESEWSDVEGDEIDKDEDDDDSDEEEEGTEEGDDDDEEDNAWKANVEETPMFDIPYRPFAHS